MKFLGGALYGLLGGAVLIALSVYVLARPTHYKTTGLPTEYLAPGAAKWKVVPSPPQDVPRFQADGKSGFLAVDLGGETAGFDPAAEKWTVVERKVEPSLSRTQTSATPTFWTVLSPTEGLAAYYDDYTTGEQRDHCQIYFEPQHEPLPRPPKELCEKAVGGTRLSTGAILAIAWDGKVKRSLRLENGAWVDEGPLPEEGNGDVVAGAGGRALHAGYGDHALMYEGGSWRVLPQNVEPRYGYAYGLANDGGVLISGGQQDDSLLRQLAVVLLPLFLLLVFVAGAVLGKLKLKLSLGGMVLGAGLSVVLSVVVLLMMLPALAWH